MEAWGQAGIAQLVQRLPVEREVSHSIPPMIGHRYVEEAQQPYLL